MTPKAGTRKTTLSNLPIVLMDDNDNRYMHHGHSADGFMTPFWPASNVDPSPTFGEHIMIDQGVGAAACIGNGEHMMAAHVAW
jgi:hypothetical protein